MPVLTKPASAMPVPTMSLLQILRPTLPILIGASIMLTLGAWALFVWFT